MKKKTSIKSSKSVNSLNHCTVLDSNPTENVGNVITSKPSHELLTYYKNKALRIEKEFDNLSDLLDSVKSACDASTELQTELNLRNEEVSRLQKVISDLHIHLYREQEQTLKLSAENDKLRIKEFENRKKIDVLLSLSGATHKELLYFVSNHPKAFVVPQKLPPKLQRLKETKSLPKVDCSLSDVDYDELLDPQVLILKNQSLAAQLEHHICISRDQIQALLKDRDAVFHEKEIEKSRLSREIDHLSAKLKRVQDCLCETTSKLVKAHQQYEQEKNAWIEEKDKYMKTVKMLKERVQEVHPDILGYTVSGVGSSKIRICGDTEKMKERIQEKEHLASLYQEQIIALESEVTRMKQRAETCRNIFKEKTQKMTAQVAYLKNKYDDLDRRRILEAEGFRTDIKMLRERLKDLEKKLLAKNATPNTMGPSEQQLLASAHNTLNRARQLEKELSNIKTKISHLEVNGNG